MELISTMVICGCYNPTVNESETITVAKPVRCGPLAAGFGIPAAPHLARS
jgi:hypothetical protein